MSEQQKSTDTVDQAVFVDHLTVISIVYLVFFCRKKTSDCSPIRYFGSVSRLGNALLNGLNRLGFSTVTAIEAKYFFGDMRTATGEIVWQKYYYKEVAEVGAKVRDELSSSVFIRHLGRRYFDLDRLLIYYQKKALYEGIQELLIWINAAEIIAREAGPIDVARPVLFIEKSLWHKYIKAYTDVCGVELRTYSSLQAIPTKKAWLSLWRMVYAAIVKLPQLMRSIASSITRSFVRKVTISEAGLSAPSVDQGVLAVLYGGPHLSFDPTMRSDFYWWPDSGFDYSEILLVFERPDIPLDQAMTALLKEKGIRFVAMDIRATKVEGAPVWKPSLDYIKQGVRITHRVVNAVFHSLLVCEWRALSYAIRLGPLMKNYAYWYDFYKSNDVKAVIEHMGITPEHIGRQLAMNELGGLTFAHQYSFSNRAIRGEKLPSMAIPSANVLFSFSQVTRLSWHANLPPVEQFVSVGYIYDGSFGAIKKKPAPWREELRRRGCEFVICYFDENSSDEKDAILSNEMSASTYEYLLNELIADETLGLVCKPKKPATLFNRIARISELISQAQETGRLIFLDEGGVEGALRADDGIVNWTFPAEAGLVADVAIGELLGGTAALETYLAGTATVLIDDLEMYEDPFYEWGRNKVVFNSWESLFQNLKSFRDTPNSVPGFGDWSSFIHEIDPFRDGLAGKRVGLYLRLVFTRLRRGEQPDVALRGAAKDYTNTWGSDTIATSRQRQTLW